MTTLKLLSAGLVLGNAGHARHRPRQEARRAKRGGRLRCGSLSQAAMRGQGSGRGRFRHLAVSQAAVRTGALVLLISCRREWPERRFSVTG